MALGGGDGSARVRKGEQRRRRRRGGGNRLARWLGGRGTSALAVGKRGRRDREEREKGRGPTGRGEARDGGGGISRRTAVRRGAAQVLPARGGRGERGKKNKGDKEKKERGEKISRKIKTEKGFRLYLETEKKKIRLYLETEFFPSLFRDEK